MPDSNLERSCKECPEYHTTKTIGTKDAKDCFCKYTSNDVD